MVYESQINFTLDTICPWTYIAKRRLQTALSQIRSTNPPVTFTLHISPYQLHPTLPLSGTDKHAWYTEHIYSGSSSNMAKYTTVMTALGLDEGINFKFTGTIANTLPAHRAVFWAQREFGGEVAGRVVDALYAAYFEQEKSPSAEGTVGGALREAGVEEGVVEGFLADQGVCLEEVKAAVREQAGNGVDAVPYVVVEGRRRDFTLEGAKTVEEYVKCLQSVIKESS